MKTTGKRPRGRALTTALVLTLLAALLLAGTALAAAKPGRPTAKAPAGTVTSPFPSINACQRGSSGFLACSSRTGIPLENAPVPSATALPVTISRSI